MSDSTKEPPRSRRRTGDTAETSPPAREATGGPQRFAYYNRLSAKQKATYRKSDDAPSIEIPDPAALAPLVARMDAALASGKRAAVAQATTALCDAILDQLAVPHVKIHVRIVRPQMSDGELHGLYTFAADGKPPKLEVWMRTAANENVVRFRTFFRTVMHELAHHLDVTLLALEDSFHTAGFFRRESSLVRQLLGRAPAKKAPAKARDASANDDTKPKRPAVKVKRVKAKPAKESRQLSMFASFDPRQLTLF